MTPTSVPTIVDAPAGYAAARCLAARIRDRERWVTNDHPSRCGWCDLPTEVLDEMVTRFNGLVDFDIRNRTSTTGAVEFQRQKREVQLEAIRAAQALEDEAPPAPKAVAQAAVAEAADRASAASTSPIASDPVRLEPAAAAPPPRPDWLGGPS